MPLTRRTLLTSSTAMIFASVLPWVARAQTPKGPTMDKSQEDALIDQIAKGVSYSFRTPILRRPSDYGMAYEDVFFPAMDGVMLDGWFIPVEGSNKLVIVNHFIGANRYGYPGHLEPWTGQGGFEVSEDLYS